MSKIVRHNTFGNTPAPRESSGTGNTHCEALLISSVLRQQDHLTPASKGLTSLHFHAFQDEWKFIETYIATYAKCPSKVVFQNRYPDFRVKQADDVEHLIAEVIQSHANYEITQVIQSSLDALAFGDIDKALKVLHAGTIKVENDMSSQAQDSDIIEFYDDTLADVILRQQRVSQTGLSGLPTGFGTLDNLTGGAQPGNLIVVGGRLGEGKSWTLIRMATAAVMSGAVVHYHSLEMSRPSIAMRVHTFLSSEVGQDLFRNLDLMQGRNFDIIKYKKFLKGLKGTVGGKFHVSDTRQGHVGSAAIAAGIERNKPDAVYIDYLTLMQMDGDDWRAISKLTKALKNIAEQYQVPIITAAQLNRTATQSKGIAGPEALAQADAIGHDADVILNMKMRSKRVIEMRLVKNRNGQGDEKWWTEFRPNSGYFREIDYDGAQDLMAEDETEDV